MTPFIAESFDLEMLEGFVLNETDHLKQIEQHLNRFNLFEVLGGTLQTEQHSSILAWLLNPIESHGIGEYFLKLLIKKFYYLDAADKIKYNLVDVTNAKVYRDYEGVDILVVNEEVKLTISIKHFSDNNEADGPTLLQTFKQIENRWGGDVYTNFYLYITPRYPLRDIDGIQDFQALNYPDLNTMMQELINNCTLDTQVLFFIQSYIDSMEQNIEQENEYIRLAQQIYKKHQKAIDFIVQHKPDYTNIFSEVKQYFSMEKSTEYKLLTPNDSQVIRILPQEVYPIFVREQFASWEDTKAMFAIELFFDTDHIWAQFCFGGIWGAKNKPEEKARLQQIKTRYFDRMRSFPSLQSALVRTSKSTSSYPSIANFTLLKPDDILPAKEQLFEVFLERFRYFEQEVLQHWKHEVLLNLP